MNKIDMIKKGFRMNSRHECGRMALVLMLFATRGKCCGLLGLLFLLPVLGWGQSLPTLSTEGTRSVYRINVAINNSGLSYQSNYNISQTSSYVSVQNATTDNEKWYFVDALFPLPSFITNPHTEHYCYIVNVQSGKYLYYTGSTSVGTQSNIIVMKDRDEAGAEAERFEFGIVKSPNTTTPTYIIYPKILGENNTSSLNKPGDLIWLTGKNDGIVNLSINKGNQWISQYTFIPETDPSCATPEITNTNGTVAITCATSDANIYYTTDGTTPSISNGTLYSTSFSLGYNTAVVKAVAYKSTNDYISTVATYNVPRCATPEITNSSGSVTITCATEEAIIYYTTDGNDPVIGSSSTYGSPLSLLNNTIVKALAVKEGYYKSCVSARQVGATLDGSGTDESPYLIASDADFANFVSYYATNPTDAGKVYKITADIVASGIGTIEPPFSGKLEAAISTTTKMPYRIKNLSAPLFTTLTGTVKNLVLENVNISGHSGNTGAIACKAEGSARIYNVGILSGSVGGTAFTGGLVGLLDDEARVVTCYSYADITGGTFVGGIVGYNNVATTSANLKTMVFGCMFYGDITGGTNKAPVYNGIIITNESSANGVNNFNYFNADVSYVQDRIINTYNCALMAEGRFLQRFEFFRHLLNGYSELAGWWATGTYSKSDMLKWVLEPSQLGTDMCYPVLKARFDEDNHVIKYPSVVNIDAEHATTGKPRNQGGKLGTLTVNIQMGNGAVYNHPGTGDAEAKITTSQLTLNITDKDTTHFNFNYYKVQLPYYNDVGTKNYTGNRVVTGWKIVKINGSTTGTGTYATGADVSYDASGNLVTPYNFADRHCTNKDLYSVSGRVFNQGAYWDVPEGVSSITIEPYWAKAAYLADANADVVYNFSTTAANTMNTSSLVPNVGGGQIYNNGSQYPIAGQNQKVYTSVGNARNALDQNVNRTVYDCAIVLVGNAHNIGISATDNNRFYTIMSADFDHDNEPDYSYIIRFNGRIKVHPVKVDFLNVPGLGMAQKTTGGTGTYNFGIMQPIGWFEVTNTALFRETQFEYDHSDRGAAPIILQGGVMEQWVNGQSGGAANKTTYFLVGGNVWFYEFHRGTHQDKTLQAKHPPVSVTGGDFKQFYLTGLYTANVTSYDDNGECYINGGRFDKMAGAGMEGIGIASNNTGDITWVIDNADIKEFYAGGINAANGKTVAGNLHTIIKNSHVDLFCGGPKFGDMTSGRTVVTTATDCTFGVYFGAGYGGNSYSRYPPYNYNEVYNIEWNKWVNGDIHVQGHDSGYEGFQHHYSTTYNGVDTQIDYQFIPYSNNYNNCARLWIEYVKFSLATTRGVTSTLTGCTIESSFYGGGSLGKVDGDVVSILDGCTVKGNVYGAGYSATLPTIPVMNKGGFRTEPSYDLNAGVFLPAVFPLTVDYTWEHHDVVNQTSNAIDEENHILYTQEIITKTNLGSVSGNVTLTVKGNSTVMGSVFGGGEESSVVRPQNTEKGNTEVRILGKTKVHGNIYGGGNMGVVQGNTKVIVNGRPSEGSGTNDPGNND